MAALTQPEGTVDTTKRTATVPEDTAMSQDPATPPPPDSDRPSVPVDLAGVTDSWSPESMSPPPLDADQVRWLYSPNETP